MKTVTNKTRTPLKIPLPRGKSLHLGPGKTGQLRDDAAAHPGIKKLVEAGSIEIFDGGKTDAGATGTAAAPHTASRGFAKSGAKSRTGDR